MDAAKLKELKQFVQQCQSNPSIFSDPSLSFYRDYIESLGGKLPPSAYRHGEKPKSYVVDNVAEPDEQAQDEEDEPEIIESDIELEGDIVEPDNEPPQKVLIYMNEFTSFIELLAAFDNEPPQKMRDLSIEMTEDSFDAAESAKFQAMEAISEGKLEEAIEHLTEAILLNPTSAIMYTTRASVYIKMKKPNAAIRDANAALEINPDSGKGYKSRGMARAMLGVWGEAAKDLHLASKLDYDEEISAVLKKVEPNAHKIQEHRRKYDKLCKEREEKKIERERQRGKAEAKAAYERAKKQKQSASCSKTGGTPAGSPGGGMPPGAPPGHSIWVPGAPPGNWNWIPGSPLAKCFPKAALERAKKQKQSASCSKSGGMPGGFPGDSMPGAPGAGMPGAPGGGMPPGSTPGNWVLGVFRTAPGNMGSLELSKILNELMAAIHDREVMAAFQDPKVVAALQDVMNNPANLAKHQSNLKVASVIAKIIEWNSRLQRCLEKFGGRGPK